MNFNEYQDTIEGVAVYPQVGNNIIYPALGLAGEAGETVDKIKKIWRNQGISSGKNYSNVQREELSKEMGDVLWYLAALANELGLDLETIAIQNVVKLRDRRDRGVVKGEGDNR